MSSTEQPGTRQHWLRRLAWIAGMVVVAVVAGRLAFGAWGGSRVEAAEAAWREDPDFKALAALTRTQANAPALRLQQLAAAAGIDLEPKTPGRAGRELPAAFPAKAASGWLKAVFASSDGSVPPPPAEVSAFLAEHAADVDALVAHLAAGERPQWTMDMGRGFEAPIPNLLGHMKIMRLLVASALVDDAAGRSDRAQQALEAGWALSDSLSSRPELISGLIRVAMMRNLAAGVRRVQGPAEPWLGRFAGADMRSVVRRGFAAEAHATLAFARSGRGSAEYLDLGEPSSGFLERVVPSRFLGASEALTLRDLVRDLDALDPCTGDPSGLGQARVASLPWWDYLSKTMLPNVGGSWTRALQADLEMALTRQVLATRQALASGSPPPGSVALRCEAWSFREEAIPGGGFRVTFQGAVPWALEETATVFPLTHVE